MRPIRFMRAIIGAVTDLLSSPGGAFAGRDEGVGPAEAEGRVDQRHVGEGLREVSDHAPGVGVVLLGQQAEVVAQGEQPLEDLDRLVGTPDHVQAVDQPEGAGEERPLPALQAVDRAVVARLVAQHEAVIHQLALDRLDRADHPGVGGGQEADQRDHEDAGVEQVAVVVLGEGADLLVESLVAHLVEDLLAQGAPLVEGALELGPLLERAHGPVHGHPGHDLGVGEVPAGPAHLPDAVVGFAPALSR